MGGVLARMLDSTKPGSSLLRKPLAKGASERKNKDCRSLCESADSCAQDIRGEGWGENNIEFQEINTDCHDCHGVPGQQGL